MSDKSPDAAVENIVAEDSRASRRGRLTPLSIGVAILFGLFYAYDLFEAISNTVGVTAQISDYNVLKAAAGQAQVAVPWLLLIVDLAAPVIIYVVAFLLGRRHSALIKAAIFLIGLMTVSAVSLSLVALAGVVR
jgi:hypothetical protein